MDKLTMKKLKIKKLEKLAKMKDQEVSELDFLVNQNRQLQENINQARIQMQILKEKLNEREKEEILQKNLNEFKEKFLLLGELGTGIEIISGLIPSRYEGKNNHFNSCRSISSKAIGNGYINDEEIDYIKLSNDSEHSSVINNHAADEGDIIIKTSLPCYAPRIDDKHSGCIITLNCIIIRGVKNINKDYLVAYLNSRLCQNYIRKNCSKGTMSVLTTKKVRELPILNLDLPDQNVIAKNCADLSKKETLFNKIISLEHERIEALIERGENNGRD